MRNESGSAGVASSPALVVVVVLTGGDSTRMGAHKPALEVGGRPIVHIVLDAAAPRPTLVVGHADAVPPSTPVIADDRPGGGPVAGLAAGVRAVSTMPDAVELGSEAPDVVVVVAADLPFLTSGHIDRLVAALERGASGRGGEPGPGVAVTVDADGRRNWLCSAWRHTALVERLARVGDPFGQSMRALAAGADVVAVNHAGEAIDVDTPEELEAARRLATRNTRGT